MDRNQAKEFYPILQAYEDQTSKEDNEAQYALLDISLSLL